MPRAKPKTRTTPSDLPVTARAIAWDLKYKLSPLSDLKPYPRNPRHISKAAIAAVADSLKAFGWQQPIVIDPKRVIVAGHTRRLAALQLKWTHAPTVTIAAKHAKAYRLADNRSGEFSSWDLDVLPGELASLPAGQLEALPALDFDALVLPQPVEGQTDPDAIPVQPKPRTKPGDVWTLGAHRMMCGDAGDDGDVSRLMDGAKADLLLTDPPYGLKAARKDHYGDGVKRHITGFITGRKVAKRDYGDSDWDDNPMDLVTLKRVMDLAKHQIVWGGNYFDLGPARCYLVWDKLRGDTAYADGELAWTNLDRSVRFIRHKWNGFIRAGNEERYHPTQKPHDVMLWALDQAPESCKRILDPFVGSGTTLIAAERQRRACYAMEISPAYCDVAVARWEAFTGRKGEKS